MKHSYSSISQFYIFSGAFEAAAEALAVEAAEAAEAAEAWAEVETVEFEFNTSSMKPLNETQLQLYLAVLSFLLAF